MYSLEDLLCGLNLYAVKKGLIEEVNENMHLDKLCALFDIPSFRCHSSNESDYHIIMSKLLDIAYEKKLFPIDTIDEKDAFEAKIMDLVMPSPTEVKLNFHKLYRVDPNLATNYLFNLSKNVNYIKVKRLKENLSWQYESIYGLIELTVNLAKPEKDPRDIAKALEKPVLKSDLIPSCVICKENEQNYHNARMNLRIVPITLGNELWHFQYSPYQYYDEHAIILHDIHHPMEIKDKTFDYLLDFVDMFPTYFIGSNADLPIVGGSILNHDHFQAGKYHFPFEDAKVIYQTTYNSVLISHLNWPLSTIRLTSKNRDEIKKTAISLFHLWINCENKDLDIVPYTDHIRHNTITPIVRKKDQQYEIDLILRNNRTSDKYPDGIFHPHLDVQHIKKENIGLIEAMGVAILPGRLKQELQLIKDVINMKHDLDPMLVKHQDWIVELKSKYKIIDDIALNNEVGKKFTRVLEDAGVFKQNQSGRDAINQIIEDIKKS